MTRLRIAISHALLRAAQAVAPTVPAPDLPPGLYLVTEGQRDDQPMLLTGPPSALAQIRRVDPQATSKANHPSRWRRA